jgi:hypothetical protein
LQPFDLISQQPQILSQITYTRAVFPDIASERSFTPTKHLELHSFVLYEIIKSAGDWFDYLIIVLLFQKKELDKEGVLLYTVYDDRCTKCDIYATQ